MGKTRMKKGMFIGSIVLAFSLATTTSAFAKTDPTKALKTKITQLTNQVNSLKKQVTSLTSQVSGLKKQITTLTSQKNSADSKIKSLTSTNASLQKQITTLTSQKNSADSKVTSLTSTNASLQKQITTLTNDTARLNKLVPTVKAGKVYQDGIESGKSNFLVMNDKQYVEIGSIIPVLSTYTDKQYFYDNTNLYLGAKPNNNTIKLTQMPTYEVEDGNWDESLSFNSFNDTSNFTVNGKKYYNGIGGEVRYTSVNDIPTVTYKLGGKYNKLNFLMGLDDITGTGNKGNIVIFGDDEVIFDSGDLDYLDDVKTASVDTSGLNFIRIEFHTKNEYDVTYPCIINPVLQP